MKLTVDIKGLDAATQALAERFSLRRLNAAAATALTRTAVDMHKAERAELARTIDRPTPYTLSAMRYVGASADRLEAWVGFDVQRVTDIRGQTLSYTRGETPASRYMLPQVEGGARVAKRFERLLQVAGHLPAGWFAVPGAGARLDAYGNVSRGQVIQVLSQLRITGTAGYTRNMSDDARKQIAAQRKAGGRFFVVRPGARIAPGVYQREFTGRNITPIFIFVNRATYRSRFDFYGVARRVASERLPVHLRQAIEASAQRLSGRSG